MRRLVLPALVCLVLSGSLSGSGSTTAPADVKRSLLPSRTVRPFSMSRARQPEPVVFTYMRLLAASPGPVRAIDLRNKVRHWRILAHDRKRNLGINKWVAPKEIIRRRRIVERLLREAEELADKVPRSSDRTGKDSAKRRRAVRAVRQKLKDAAVARYDPILRNFLIGAAAQAGKEYPLAEKMFRKCREEAPRVAAFHQAQGLALLKVKRPLDALAAFTEALRLRPDSATALRLVRQAAQAVPGARIDSPVYVAAKNLLDQYPEPKPSHPWSKGSSNTMEWLMPGKSLRVGDLGLPAPRYDRLIFRQAVAVPVGRSTLLVDAGVVADALELHVRIDDKTFASGRVRRLLSRGRRKGKAAPPLALVRVDGFEFTPVKTDPAATFDKDQQVVAFGLSVFEEMGQAVRRISTRLQADKAGRLMPASVLAAGESASPVLTDDDRLVGFLTGKTDVTADGGGTDRLIGVGDLKDLLKRARSRARSRWPSKYRRIKRLVTAKPIEGNAFVIYATAGEKLEE